jgi:23S rRNA (guanosine2251-2'-O)-methyltransferase
MKSKKAASGGPITIWGINPVHEFIKVCPEAIKRIYVLPSFGRKKRQRRLLEFSKKRGLIPDQVSGFSSLRIPSDAVHQGVSATVLPVWDTAFDTLMESVKSPNSLFLLCDGVTDPQNFGAIIRSAVSFGVDAVVVPRRNSSPVTGTVAKASSGTISRAKIWQVGNLAKSMVSLKENGFVIMGLSPGAEQPIWDLSISGKIALVAGAEGKGLRHLVKKNCDILAMIPLSEKSLSLNVATATGIALYEAARQRRQGLC